MEASILSNNQTNMLGRSEIGTLVTHEYILLMKLFCYEVFATVVTWTLTNVVRNFYRHYFLNLEENPEELELMDREMGGNIENSQENYNIHESLHPDTPLRLRHHYKSKSDTSVGSNKSDISSQASYSVYTKDSETDKALVSLKESLVETEEAVVNFEEEQEKKSKIEENTKQIELEQMNIEVSEFKSAINLDDIKVSLRLTEEVEMKNMNELEKSMKGLKIEAELVKTETAVEEGDVNVSLGCKSQISNVCGELGALKIGDLNDKLENDANKIIAGSSDELKEQYSSPI